MDLHQILTRSLELVFSSTNNPGLHNRGMCLVMDIVLNHMRSLKVCGESLGAFCLGHVLGLARVWRGFEARVL